MRSLCTADRRTMQLYLRFKITWALSAFRLRVPAFILMQAFDHVTMDASGRFRPSDRGQIKCWLEGVTGVSAGPGCRRCCLPRRRGGVAGVPEFTAGTCFQRPRGQQPWSNMTISRWTQPWISRWFDHRRARLRRGPPSPSPGSRPCRAPRRSGEPVRSGPCICRHSPCPVSARWPVGQQHPDRLPRQPS